MCLLVFKVVTCPSSWIPQKNQDRDLKKKKKLTHFFTLLKKSLTISDHRTLMVLFGCKKFTHPVGGVVYIISHGFNQSDRSQTLLPDNWYRWREETPQSSRTRLSHTVLKFIAHSRKENVHLCNITQGNGEQKRFFFQFRREHPSSSGCLHKCSSDLASRGKEKGK